MKELKREIIEQNMFEIEYEITVKLESKDTIDTIIDIYDIGWTCGHTYDGCGCYGWNIFGGIKSIGDNQYCFRLYGRANV